MKNIKYKIIILLIIFKIILDIYLIYLNVPKYINGNTAKIKIYQPQSLTDIALEGGGTGLLSWKYLGNRSGEFYIYNNGIILYKSYKDKNYIYLPNYLEKLSEIEYVGKIKKEEVTKLDNQLKDYSDTYKKGDITFILKEEKYPSILIKGDDTRYLGNDKVIQILKKYNIDIYKY